MFAQIDSRYMQARPWKLWARLLSYALFEGRPLTTRGRWINPIVFTHFALEKRLPQFKTINQPVFILGTGRSGTTILGMVLSMHHDVGFLNEPKALWHSVYAYEDLIGSYSSKKAKYRLDSDDASPQVIRASHHLFGAYLMASFSSRVVDKYPEMIFRVPFLKAIFPDAKFLFLVRNGWDTCSSIEQWSDRLGKTNKSEVHDWWGVNSRKWTLLVDQLVPEHHDLAVHQQYLYGLQSHTDRAAVEWIITMREGLRLVNKYPNDVMRITYEELCQFPSDILESVCDFADLGKDEVFLDYANKTLRSPSPKKPFRLDSAIEDAFHETMTALGYSE